MNDLKTNINLPLLYDMRKHALIQSKDSVFEDGLFHIIHAMMELTFAANKEGLLALEEAAQSIPSGIRFYQDIQTAVSIVCSGAEPEDLIETLTSRYWSKNLQGEDALIYYMVILSVVRIQDGISAWQLEQLLTACLSEGNMTAYEVCKKQQKDREREPDELKNLIRNASESDLLISFKGLSIPAKKKLLSVIPEYKAKEYAGRCEYMGPVRQADVVASMAKLICFFKNHIRLDILEWEQILLQSYVSMQQKISMMKELALYGTDYEFGLLNEHCAILEQCMSDIYQPTRRSVFVLECVEPYFEDCHIQKVRHINGFYDTIDELLREVKLCFQNFKMQLYGYVTLLQIPRSGKTKTLFDFTMFWMDGEWQVKDIIVGKEYMIQSGFSEKNMEGLNQDNRFMPRHFPLPFENGERLKLQMPFMEEPFYGILDSVCRYPGEWHHYLWDENIMALLENKRNLYTRENMEKCVNLSHMEIFVYNGYSILDWLERA